MEEQSSLEIEWFECIPAAEGYALAALIKTAYGLAKVGSSVFKRFPKMHIHGQLVYTHIQDQLLSVLDTDSIWRPRLERHPKGTTSFVTLTNEHYRLHVAKTDSEHDDPMPRLFLEIEQARQLEFNLGVSRQRIVELVHGGGEDREHLDEPAHMGIRFADGRGGFLLDYIDLKRYLRQGEMPKVERQTGNVDTPPRIEEQHSEGDEGA